MFGSTCRAHVKRINCVYENLVHSHAVSRALGTWRLLCDISLNFSIEGLRQSRLSFRRHPLAVLSAAVKIKVSRGGGGRQKGAVLAPTPCGAQPQLQ
jgi:hypothetical protein